MECQVCMSPFNKSKNMSISCPNPACSYVACKECIRTYILGTIADPHCMNCRRPYEEEFLTKNLNTSWIKNDFKKHRKQLLIDREIAQFPQTMPMVEHFKELDRMRERQIEYKKHIEDLKHQLKLAIAEKDVNTRNIIAMENGKRPITKKEFIMPCSYANCNGFLSTQYKCAVCSRYTCSRCHVGIGNNKVDPNHTCNEDDVKSAELIKKDSKPCPSCGTRISKISGCSQMWCPHCKQAWNWNTGQIDNGYIHNPHFQEWQNGNGGGARMPGDIICGGLPALSCFKPFIGGWKLPGGQRFYIKRSHKTSVFVLNKNWLKPKAHDYVDYDVGNIDKIFNNINPDILNIWLPTIINMSKISDILRNLHDFAGRILPVIRTDVRRAENNETLRARYIIGKITKERFGQEVIKRDTLRKKTTDLMHIWELIIAVTTDLYNNLKHELSHVEIPKKEVNTLLSSHYIPFDEISDYEKMIAKLYPISSQFIKKLDSIRQYSNHRFGIISATYSLTTPYLDELYKLESKKHTSKIFSEPHPTLNV